MHKKEFEFFIKTNYPSQTNILFSQLQENIFQSILHEINQCLLFYHNRFYLNSYLDSFNKYNISNDIEKQKNLLINIVYIVNYLSIKEKSNKKHNNQLIIFIINIIGKLFNKNKININPILIFAHYLTKTNNIEFLFELFRLTRCNNEIFQIILSTPLQHNTKERIKKYINTLSFDKSTQLLSDIMSLDKNKYKPYDFISELFVFNFNPLTILFLTNFIENDTTGIFLSKLENTLLYLTNVIDKEQKIIKNDKNKIMNGLIMKNAFKLNKQIGFEKNEYFITFSFLYYECDNSIKEKQYILGFSKDKTNPEYKLCFYVLKNHFYVSLDKTVIRFDMFDSLKPNTTYDVLFHYKKPSFFGYENVSLEINNRKISKKMKEIFEGNLYVYIGKFYGEIKDIEIKSSGNIMKNELPLLEISSKLMYENYQLNNYLNEYNVISNVEDEDMKICKLYSINDNEFYDIPFMHKLTKDEFIHYSGNEFLNLMMVSILNFTEINKDIIPNVIDSIYSSISLIFQLCFESIFNYNNHNNLHKEMSLLYTFTRIMNNIFHIKKIPKEIVNKLFLYIKINNKRFQNRIYMILFNTFYNDEIDENIIRRFQEDIDVILKECFPEEIEYYIHIFINKENVHEHILQHLLLETKDEYIVNYLLKALDMFLVHNNHEKCFKLLSILYLTHKTEYINSEKITPILKKCFDIITLYDNNEYQLLRAITILIINDLLIKKSTTKISVSYISTSSDAKNNSSNNNDSLNNIHKCIETILSLQNITIPILKAILFIPFENKDRKLIVSYITSTNNTPNTIHFDCIYSYDIITKIFSIITKLLNNNELIIFYNEFLKTFVNDIITESSKGNSNSLNIFKSSNIFVNIFYNIIILNSNQENISLFDINYLFDIISNPLSQNSEPFYFELIYQLIKTTMTNNNDNLRKDISKMLTILIELTRPDNVSSKEGLIYLKLNHKNIIVLFYNSLSMILNSTSNDNNNKTFNKELLKTIFDLFIKYIEINLKKNPMFYIRTLFNHKSNIEVLFNIFSEICLKIETVFQNNNIDLNIIDLQQVISIFNSIIFPEWIKSKKTRKINEIQHLNITHSIFFYMDKYEKKSNTLKESVLIEKELIRLNEGTPNTYLYTILFLKKVSLLLQNNCDLLSKDEENDLLLNTKSNITYKEHFIQILQKLQDNLIVDINTNLNQLVQITIDNNDIHYSRFKEKIFSQLEIEKNYITGSFVNQILISIPFAEPQNKSNSNTITKERKTINSWNSNTIKNENENISVTVSVNNTDDNEDTIDNAVNNNNNNNIATPQYKEKTYKDDKEYNTVLVNESLWFDDYKEYGIKSIHDYKLLFYKTIFGCFNINEFYKDKYDLFMKKVIPLYKESTSFSLDYDNVIKYPTKIRNYITNTYEKPLLKLNRKFYYSDTLQISHNYLPQDLINTVRNDNKHKLIKHKMIFNKNNKLHCELITNEGSIYCKVYFSKGILLIKSVKNPHKNPKEKNIFSSMEYIHKNKYTIIYLNEITEIISRTFLYKIRACEITISSHKTYFLNFFTCELLRDFYSLLQTNFRLIDINIQPITKLETDFTSKGILKQWHNHKLSTWHFLNLVNKYSSRTYNDLNQYPVFPWLCETYEKKEDLEENSKIRLFEYPLSLQKIEKRTAVEEKVQVLTQSNEDNNNITENQCKYDIYPHLSVFYSLSAFLYYYLVRLSPITEGQIYFQSGNFDEPTRMFSEIRNTKTILEKYKDNRELIPELFNFPELVYNINCCSLGKNNDMFIHNLVLPINCINASHFIYLHRKKLESNEVCSQINKWINNIFGCYNQYQKRKEKNFFYNLYNWQNYWDSSYEISKLLNSEIEDKNEQITQIISYILNFGNGPYQLFTEFIDNRKPNKNEKNLLTKTSNKKMTHILDPQNISEKIQSNKNNNFKYNCIKKYIPQEFKEQKDMKILTLFYTSVSIIIINSYNIFLIYNIQTFKLEYRMKLDNYFTFISKQCLIEIPIEINNQTFPLYIIGNFTNNYVKCITIHYKKCWLSTQRHIISAMHSLTKNGFWAGTTKGNIIKYTIETKPTTQPYELIQSSPIIMNHINCVINSIIYNEILDVVITIASDNKIMIRNASVYELLNVIEISNSSVCELELNEYNMLYVFDIGKQFLKAFTINGMNVCKGMGGVHKDLCTFIDKERIFYYNKTTHKLIELSLYSINEIQNEWDIWFGNKYNITYLEYCKELECFDFWTDTCTLLRVYLRKEKGMKKQANVNKINSHNEDITNNNSNSNTSESQGLLQLFSNVFSYS